MNLTGINGTLYPIHREWSAIPMFMNLIVGLPTHTYVLWLMANGGRDSLATDFFALQLTVGELLHLILCVIYAILRDFFIAIHLEKLMGFTIGLVYSSRPVFQCFMCLERYLAVVKPVVFQKYRALRYKVASLSVALPLVAGCCTAYTFVRVHPAALIAAFALFLACFSVNLFCCAAVLKALKHPGPGDGNRDKKREGTNVKMRAFRTILVSLCAMMLNGIPVMVVMLWYFLYCRDACKQLRAAFTVLYTFVVVAGYVQPCLYLHRMGKLPCKKP